MTGTIIFEYDANNDIIIATPKWHVITHNDCEEWYKQWAEYVSKFNRKLDIIMVLDEFKVESKIAAEWGKYRAKVINTYTRFSCRVNSSYLTSIYVKTSGIQHHASAQESKTIEGAYEVIMAERKKAGI
jgi:hypothetical protein